MHVSRSPKTYTQMKTYMMDVSAMRMDIYASRKRWCMYKWTVMICVRARVCLCILMCIYTYMQILCIQHRLREFQNLSVKPSFKRATSKKKEFQNRLIKPSFKRAKPKCLRRISSSFNESIISNEWNSNVCMHIHVCLYTCINMCVCKCPQLGLQFFHKAR
jgi:hypothetical protein